MPSPRYHFISGLPRLGLTLSAAIRRQNSQFIAGMSRSMGSFVSNMLGLVSAKSEFGTQVDNRQRNDLLIGLFDSYYKAENNKDIIFDTNRMWCAMWFR